MISVSHAFSSFISRPILTREKNQLESYNWKKEREERKKGEGENGKEKQRKKDQIKNNKKEQRNKEMKRKMEGERRGALESNEAAEMNKLLTWNIKKNVN